MGDKGWFRGARRPAAAAVAVALVAATMLVAAAVSLAEDPTGRRDAAAQWVAGASLFLTLALIQLAVVVRAAHTDYRGSVNAVAVVFCAATQLLLTARHAHRVFGASGGAEALAWWPRYTPALFSTSLFAFWRSLDVVCCFIAPGAA